MKKLSFGVIAFIIILVSLISCQKDQSGDEPLDYTLNQYLYLPNENGDSSRLSDPHVIKVGDKWYLYGTGYTELGFECWSTADLVRWKYEGYVWEPKEGAWHTKYKRFWAPDVFQGADGFYLYYSANGHIGVAYSASPTGPFIDVYDHPFVGGGYGGVGDGVFLTDYDVNNWANTIIDFEEYAIDAHVFKASDGSLTLYFSILYPFAGIAALPLSDPVTIAAEQPVKLLETNVLSWESIGLEAPFMIENDGTFHLMYSGGFHPTPHYAVGVATGKSPLGPFQKRADNPILRQSERYKLLSSAHNSAVPGKYNDWLIFFHSRDWGQPNGTIRTRYMQMYFDKSGQLRVNKVLSPY
jgi:beta-xylosidase